MRRLPAEWEPHERTLMAWPCRASLWGETLAQARSDYAAVARAIARFEPVTMVANPGAEAAAAAAACGDGVDVLELPIDDSWLRDNGPIWVLDGDRDGAGRLAVHFGFNAWGGKFPPWDRDAAAGELIAAALGEDVEDATGFVLEGGSILSDGAGTVLTTEQCLLNPNLNPGRSRGEIEAELRARLGAERVVWLGRGLAEDRDTDGHVDLVACFLSPDRVLLQSAPPGNPNHAATEDNRARLEATGIEVLELPHLPYLTVAGESVAASYMNLYLCNGAAIVPVTGADTDREALAIIGDAFPGREVVAVPGAVIAYGGGGPHCITQQVPRV